jgi:hypothetical protein
MRNIRGEGSDGARSARSVHHARMAEAKEPLARRLERPTNFAAESMALLAPAREVCYAREGKELTTRARRAEKGSNALAAGSKG